MCGTQQRSWGQELAIYIPTGIAAAGAHTNCTALGSAPPPLQGMSLAAGVDLQDIARRTEGYRWAAAGWPRGCKDAACIFHFHFIKVCVPATKLAIQTSRAACVSAAIQRHISSPPCSGDDIANVCNEAAHNLLRRMLAGRCAGRRLRHAPVKAVVPVLPPSGDGCPMSAMDYSCAPPPGRLTT